MRKNNTHEKNILASKFRKMVNDKLRVKKFIHGKNFNQMVNPLRKVR